MSNSTTKSWAQLVREADEDWERERLRPVVYEFGNGRKFVDKPDPYAD